MNDLLVAVINGGFGVVVVILGVRLTRKVNRVREQVENDHPKNMREEQDERHQENADKLDALIEDVRGIRATVRALWMKSEKHDGELDALDDRVQEIEHTQPPAHRGRHSIHI